MGVVASTDLLTCTQCSATKQAKGFPRRNNRTSGRQSRCKVCTAAAARGQPLERTRQNNLKRYGLTPETFNEMLRSQKGTCKVCAGPPMGKGQFHVDHNHKTGRVRGLLCHKCNVALGMAGDSVDRLIQLAAYLDEEIT